MKILAIAVSVSLAPFALSAAYAECPATGLQDAANIYASAGQPGADPGAIATRTDALAKECASNPHVQQVAAMTFHALTAKAGDAGKAFDRAASAWNYLDAMRKVRGPSEAPAKIMVNGKAIQIDVYAADELDEALLLDLLIAEVKSRKRHPDHRPLTPDEKPRACEEWDALDVQNAAWFVRKNSRSDVQPALDFIERAYAACTATIDKGDNPRILGLRAMAFYTLVKENPKRPGAAAMLDKALADSRRYFEINPKGDAAYWSYYDRDRLNALLAEIRRGNKPLPSEVRPGNKPLPPKALPGNKPLPSEVLPANKPLTPEVRPGSKPLPPKALPGSKPLPPEVLPANKPLPPEEDWFKRGNPQNPKVVRAIAAKLDDAWAIDAPLGESGAFKNYRDAIGAFYDKARASGNVGPARHAIALAAQGHANGSMRKAATKSLDAPPASLWDWLDSTVKP